MTKYETGARVIARGLPGYPGIVQGEYAPGMYEVRLASGDVVVPGEELTPADGAAPELKGLPVYVYRTAGLNCTNGVSRDHNRVTVVGVVVGGRVEPLPRNCRVFAATEAAPAVVLRPGHGGGAPHLVSIDVAEGRRPAGAVGPMFGGNYAGGGDSRWGALGKLFGVGRLDLVAVHDRMESRAEYMELGQ